MSLCSQTGDIYKENKISAATGCGRVEHIGFLLPLTLEEALPLNSLCSLGQERNQEGALDSHHHIPSNPLDFAMTLNTDLSTTFACFSSVLQSLLWGKRWPVDTLGAHCRTKGPPHG